MSHTGGAERQEAAAEAQASEASVEPTAKAPDVAVARVPDTEAKVALEPAVKTFGDEVVLEAAGPTEHVAASTAASTTKPACYSTSEMSAEFRQGEIITGLEQVVRITDGNAEVKQHPFAIVLSQDCDLAADYRARRGPGSKSAMNGILLFEAHPLEGFMGNLGFNSKEKKQVMQYDHARYHTLERGTATDDLQAQGFTALAIDFRRYFTLTADDIIGQLTLSARRRTRLVSPFVEHLQSRAMTYLGRVALPDRN